MAYELWGLPNQKAIYEAIEKHCYEDGKFNRECAQHVIYQSFSRAFLNTSNQVSDIEKTLGNMRIPDEARTPSAKWYYRKAMDRINTVIKVHQNENAKYEKKLLEIMYK